MSSNDFIRDAAIRHQILLQRAAGGVYRKAIPLVDAMRRDLRANIAAGDIRRAALLAELDAIILVHMQGIEAAMRGDLDKLAVNETEYTAQLLNKGADVTFDLPTEQQILAIVPNLRMSLASGKKVQELTISQAIAQFTDTNKRAVRTAIQSGIVEGRTLDQIVGEVDRLARTRTLRQTEALVRTSVNAVGAEARSRVYGQNADLLEGERWSSTLDGRTSIVCAGRDGQIRPVGGWGGQPPAHYNCRSVLVPVVKKQYTIPGMRGTRSSIDGPVSNKTTYNSWLKRQSVGFQDEVLGPERAGLFRRGKLTLSQFSDDSGCLYSMDDLRRLHPLTFE